MDTGRAALFSLTQQLEAAEAERDSLRVELRDRLGEARLKARELRGNVRWNVGKESMNDREEPQGAIQGKAAYAKQRDTCQQATTEWRPSLTERVQMQAHEANRQSAKATRMQELADLLSKNPDVARILELMGEFNG